MGHPHAQCVQSSETCCSIRFDNQNYKGVDEFGDGTKELDLRNPMTITGPRNRGLVKVWAKKNVVVPHPIHRLRQTPIRWDTKLGNERICEKIHTTRAGRNREKCFPTFYLRRERVEIQNNVKGRTFPYSRGV